MNIPARILVVEDESIVAFNLQQRLTQMGYDVPAVAVSGQETFDLVNELAPDLVLMDIHIQGDMDGIEVASRLRDSHAIPVIYLSAYSEDSTLERAKLTQPYGYLLKPFSERELESELVRNQRLLQQALDAASMGVLEINASNLDVTASTRTTEMLGLSGGQVTLGDVLSRIDPDDRSAVSSHLEDCLQDLKQFSNEFRLLASEGPPRWVRIEAAHWPGKRLSGVVQDVTDRKNHEIHLGKLNAGLEELVSERTAELKQSLKELEAFSYSVAHDLRAPLRAIVGFSQELLREHPSDFGADDLALIHRIAASGQRMSNLIDALLHMSRLNQLPMQLRQVSLSDTASSIATELMASSPERVAHVQISPNLVAMGDPTLVHSLLDNLLSNAWKYSARRMVTRIDVGAKTVNGETVFFVRDNGCGFDMASADRLFGPFQRLHREEEYAGIGIGLTIVQRIVMRHGGRVWAFSEPDQGTAFHFTLSS
jgi:PAS domain S-box-containing protein